MSCLSKGKFDPAHTSVMRSTMGELINNSKQINLILRDLESLCSLEGVSTNTEEEIAFLSQVSLPSVTADQLASLDGDVTENEVETAIKHLALGKAPCPDRIMGNFKKTLET